MLTSHRNRAGLFIVGLAVLVSAGCADVSTKHIGIVCTDGYAAPGEDVEFEVFTKRALGGTIHSVFVTAPQFGYQELKLYENTNPVGVGIIETKTGFLDMLREIFVGNPDHEVRRIKVPVPKDHEAARLSVPLELTVNYGLAEWKSSVTFRGSSGQDVLVLPITVLPEGNYYLAQLRDLGMYALLLLAITLAYRVARLPVAKSLHGSAEAARFALAVSWFGASLYFVVWPTGAVFGLSHWWSRVLVGLVPITLAYLVVSLLMELLAPAPAFGKPK
ncbi:MAG: hypothetical protein AB7K24_07295 [Gemmataceae bacterium]